MTYKYRYRTTEYPERDLLRGLEQCENEDEVIGLLCHIVRESGYDDLIDQIQETIREFRKQRGEAIREDEGTEG